MQTDPSTVPGPMAPWGLRSSCSLAPCVLGFHRRLLIEDLEARIALMPLLLAEKDRR
jgi:hypothetical protein